MAEDKSGQCEIEGCRREAVVVVNRNGQWKCVFLFHNAPKHWKLKDDFDANPSLFGAQKKD